MALSSVVKHLGLKQTSVEKLSCMWIIPFSHALIYLSPFLWIVVMNLVDELEDIFSRGFSESNADD